MYTLLIRSLRCDTMKTRSIFFGRDFFRVESSTIVVAVADSRWGLGQSSWFPRPSRRDDNEGETAPWGEVYRYRRESARPVAEVDGKVRHIIESSVLFFARARVNAQTSVSLTAASLNDAVWSLMRAVGHCLQHSDTKSVWERAATRWILVVDAFFSSQTKPRAGRFLLPSRVPALRSHPVSPSPRFEPRVLISSGN